MVYPRLDDTKMNLWLGALLLVAVAAASADNGPQLTLLPSVPEVTQAKGKDIAVTCSLTNGNAQSITNFQWLDPKNRTIDANYKNINGRFSIMMPQNERRVLLIYKLADGDVGKYTCVADYDTLKLTASISIKTYLPITFIDAPVEQSASIGKDYKVKCQVEANPSPQLEWLRNGQRLTNNELYVYEQDGLVIRKVRESDDGDYTCQVIVPETGDLGLREIHLEVTSPPLILPNLVSPHEVVEGEPTSIKCEAKGKPKPTISWIRMKDAKKLTTGPDEVLYIQKTTKDDDSDFKCVATNKAGQAERTVKFSVLSKPEIVEIKNGTAPVGGAGQIQCYVAGNPDPTVIIRKLGFHRPQRSVDNNELPNQPNTNNEVVVKTVMKNDRRLIEATMNFNRVERYMDGLYECMASNTIAQKPSVTTRNLHFAVEFPPTFEKSGMVKEVVTWNNRPANLTCIAESIPNATITWYHGNSKNPINPNPDRYYRIFGNGPKSVLQVTPLDKQFYATYKCLAKNFHGEATYDIRLSEAFAPYKMNNPQINSTTATTVTFRFMDPPFNGGLPIKGYIVQYMEEGPRSDDWSQAKNETWIVDSIYTIDKLKPMAKYVFRFAAINEVGRGEWSGYLTAQLPAISWPSEPVIMNAPVNNEKYIRSQYARKIDLRWKIPSNNGAPMDKYALKFCNAELREDRPDGLEELQNTCQTKEFSYFDGISTYTITDLSPDTFYKVYLTAHNEQGYSQASIRYFKTNGDTETETPAKMDEGLSSAVIIYIVVAILIALLVIVDIFCFFVGNMGVLHLLCGTCCGRKKKHDDKLGSESKDLISNGHKKIDIEEQAPMIVDGSKKDTAVEYDVKKGTSKTGFVGKDSAV